MKTAALSLAILLASSLASAHSLPSYCKGKLGTNTVELNLSWNVSLMNPGTDLADYGVNLKINGQPLEKNYAPAYKAILKSAKMKDSSDTRNSCVIATGTAKVAVVISTSVGAKLPLILDLRCEDHDSMCD